MNKMKLTYEKQSQLRHVNSSLQIKLTYLAQPDEFTGESPYLAAMTSQQYEISEFILQFYKAMYTVFFLCQMHLSRIWRYLCWDLKSKNGK